jgi:hypothetical protein
MITRGEPSFFWIQSMLSDDGDRALLFDLDTAIQRLTVDMADHPSAVRDGGVPQSASPLGGPVSRFFDPNRRRGTQENNHVEH